jgi:hypothetical protein
MGRDLSFFEFSQFYKVTGYELSEQDFEVLKGRYCSTKDGITLRGLQDFFKDMVKEEGEDVVRAWLKRLGYDEHLFNPNSRNFNVTFHGTKEFNVTVKDALQTDLDTWVVAAIALKQVE